MLKAVYLSTWKSQNQFSTLRQRSKLSELSIEVVILILSWLTIKLTLTFEKIDVEKIDIEKIDIEILIAFEAITPSKGVTETTSLPTIWKSFINHSLADISER